ncbi:MAG: hypothetical protein PHF86_14325 [Candidatus Nanoarchaeia archaeon]|nr:hypothetical protein [Candidatus Nanoarchaeia archaeon]
MKLKKNIIRREIDRDEKTQQLIDELIFYKFLIYKKSRNSNYLEINLMASRMYNSIKNIKIKEKIYNRTFFLNDSSTISDRLICIYHNLYKYPICRFCGESITKFVSPLTFGYHETCGNKFCVVTYGVERRGGEQYAIGKHNFSEEGLHALHLANANRPSRKGKSWKEILKDPSKYEELLEKCSKNANRENTGWYSKYRTEFLNPNTNKIIILMSSYEIQFVNFCIHNNIWFDHCHARLKYWNEIKQGNRYYNPDFIVKCNNNYFMIEVKPSIFLKNNKNEYNIICRNKIKRLYEHCLNYNRICLIITEIELKNYNKILQLFNNIKSNYSEYINEN